MYTDTVSYRAFQNPDNTLKESAINPLTWPEKYASKYRKHNREACCKLHF